jgi:hypothetical protein
MGRLDWSPSSALSMKEDVRKSSGSQRTVDAMRGDSVNASSDLEAAYELVEVRLAELRRNREMLPALEEGETHGLLVELDTRRRLVEKQIETDRWMKNWL